LSVVEEIKQVALTSSTVLLLGETGSGKEVLAQAIHDSSAQKERAMIKVNCAALPASLIESELFGREKGAFTGALARQPGRFEIADGSTIFLDEVGELPLELQPKLLRVLQEGEFERLGGSKTIKVDARVIAATNRPLEQAVREGRFRQDLFYRLDVFPIEVPPLRERREDIPLLSWTFVKEFGNSMGKSIEEIAEDSMSALQDYLCVPKTLFELMP
jgi:transcriptional regulator with GAF, ATPase, and Fis domain